MTRWRHLFSQLPWSKRGSRIAENVLADAYKQVFQGSPLKAQQEIVLADLAAQSGYFRVSHYDVSSEQLRHREGMRQIFARIYNYVNLSPEQQLALTEAARIEAMADVSANS